MSTRVVVGIALVAGCSSPAANPPVLWLGPLNGETMVQLIDHAPPVY